MKEKKLSTVNTYIVLLVSLCLIAGCIVFGISLAAGFYGAIIFTSIILKINGFKYSEMIKTMISGIREGKSLYILILIIGATTSVWLASGVVPTMMYYGFEYMKGMNYLLAAFLIISIASLFMGTAIGTISTIGIALLGIGRGFGIPSAILVGAITSGAFIADKMSPVSGLFNVVLSTTKRSYREVVKTMPATLVPAWVITAIIYYFIGMEYGSEIGAQNLVHYQQAISSGFYISPWLLFLPVAVLTMCLLGIKTISTIFTGLCAGTVCCIWLQKMTLTQVLKAVISGYKGSTASSDLNSILISGGVKSMVEVVFIVLGAVALTSLFESSGMIQPFISRLMNGVNTRGKLILRTGIISSILTVITCDQTVGIILPGRLLQDKYKELGIDNTILARTISDTGVIIAPLMAWNINGLLIKLITGVSATDYSPYTVLCYTAPVITVAAAYLFKNKRKSEDLTV